MTPKVDLDVSQSQAPSPPTERVVAVMGLLGSSPARQFSLAEICRSLDISRATGHAILTTLAAHDWVARDPTTAGYALGAGHREPGQTGERAHVPGRPPGVGSGDGNPGLPDPPGGDHTRGH